MDSLTSSLASLDVSTASSASTDGFKMTGKHAMFTACSRQTGEMEYQWIDKVEDIQDAVQDIKKHSLIAIDCEGVDLGKEGALCLLQVGLRMSPTLYRTYLFDITTMGKPAFTSGLADVLASQSISKIFYDCRLDCVALHHQFGVTVNNIIDLQLLVVNSIRANGGRLKWMPGLKRILDQKVPGIDANLLQIKASMKARYDTDLALWASRPMPTDLMLYASVDVAYMVILHDLLMAEFRRSPLNEYAPSTHNPLLEIISYTNYVWCRTFIDGSERVTPANKTELLAQKDRVCAPPTIHAIRHLSSNASSHSVFQSRRRIF